VATGGGYNIPSSGKTATGQIAMDRRVEGKPREWQVEIQKIAIGNAEVQAFAICVPGT
jgi:hypothetical protein